ncbi:MAG: AEC family transporter [Verrucomicrobia bacterium]|nr:AEC family transporter [Verrucomicrobiota bacterium]
MTELQNVLAAVLPVFFIAGLGGLLRRVDWLSKEADQSLLSIVINLLSPCLILDAILHNETLREPANVLLPPLVGFGTLALGLVVARLVAPAAGLTDARAARTFATVTGIYNYGFVPVPLAMMLFNRDTVGVLFVHNLGVEIGIWTIGLLVLEGAGGRVEWRKLVNAPLVAIVVALVLNFAGAGPRVPAFVLKSAAMLGQCAIPMCILLVGATMYDELRGFTSAGGLRAMSVACVVRLGLLPLAFIAVAKYLPCSVELKRVIVLQAAMPAAIFPIVMAKHYGGDTATALRVVIGTSAAGFVTIPFWIQVGRKLVGV